MVVGKLWGSLAGRHRLPWVVEMDAATEVATEAKRAADSALGQALSQPPKPRRKHRATKPQLLTRDQLDKRSNAAKQFDAIADGIAQDLGGEDQLSTVQRHLVEAFAGA